LKPTEFDPWKYGAVGGFRVMEVTVATPREAIGQGGSGRVGMSSTEKKNNYC